MEILEVSINDAEILTKLTQRSKGYWDYTPEQMNAWKDELTVTPTYIENHLSYKLVEFGRILGYYSLMHYEDKAILLDNLFIEPDTINLGYGTALLNHAMQVAKELGYNKMIVESDPNAKLFYMRKGFKEIGEKMTSIPSRFLPIMGKVLH